MNKKETSVGLRLLFVLLFFACTLIFVGFLLKDRIGALLSSYTESQMKRQAETFAYLAAQKFQTELDDLEYIASKLEANPEETDILMPLIYNEDGVSQGMLSINGQAVYGKDLNVRTFDGIQASFRGNRAITYVEGGGLLFTCPVFHGPNIKYVLYRLFPENTLEDRFSISCYDDLGKVCVSSRDSQIIIPFSNITKEEKNWFESSEITGDFQSMHMEMEVSVAAAKIFPTIKGDMLLFEAEIPGTDYLVTGFVPAKVASEGINRIALLVVWVFGLLMLLVLIGALYLVRASIKLRESNALRKAKAEAEDASRAKSDFLANMSHEIRTPINAVLGMNEMILREADTPTILSYSDNIKKAGNTLLGLINDILDFSKIEAGKIELLPVDYDLLTVINDLMNMIHTRADEKGLLLQFDIDSETPRYLNGDEVRIKQIVTNILTNAVKYTEKGSVTLIVGFERLPEDSGNVLLKVSVKDTGIGIKFEDMQKLFSEFERIEEKRNRNIEGTGLGMSITKSLLELMGSSLEVDSVYGLGSTFGFTLKQKVGKWESLGNYDEAYHANLNSGTDYKEKLTAPDACILVVDDNPMNLMVFKSLVKQTRIVVETANDGDKGIALASEKKYDILFLDHMMPGKDGIETLINIRSGHGSLNASSPAICLTANAISGAREEYISAGFDDYLTKPIDPDLLENMLIEYLPKEKVKLTRADEEEKTDSPEENLPEQLKVLAGQSLIDVTTGMKNSGSPEAFLPLLKIHFDSVEEKTGELNLFYASEDIVNYTIRVHALKSSLRIIGASELGEEAQLLESAGKKGDYAYIKENHEGFIKKNLQLKELLRLLFDEPEKNSDKPEAGPELMKEVFNEVRSAAEDMDCDRLEGIFSEMEDYSIPEEDSKLFNDLKAAADRYEYDAILSMLPEE